MTVNELISEFNRLQCSGDEEVRIHAFGGMRHGKPIRAVSWGIDWDMGKVMLHPEPALTVYVPPEQRKLKHLSGLS